MPEEITLEEIMETQCALMRGIFAELRAMRLEAAARAGKLDAVGKSEMAQAQQDADQIALMFSHEPDAAEMNA